MLTGRVASIGSHHRQLATRPRVGPLGQVQMLNARRVSSAGGSSSPGRQDGQGQGRAESDARKEQERMTSKGTTGHDQSSAGSSSPENTTKPTKPIQPSPLRPSQPPPAPQPTTYPARPTPTPTQSSTSLSSFLGSKAKSSLSFLNTTTSPYRSALSSATSYVASQTGLGPDRSVKGNAEGNEKEKSWGEWARDWRARRGEEGKAEEMLGLLPGWVVLVPREVKKGGKSDTLLDDDVKPFDLHISTSGFANSLRSPENASRSQRVFMKIAKSFAALPNLPAKIAEDLGGELKISPLATPTMDRLLAGTGVAPGSSSSKLVDEPGELEQGPAGDQDKPRGEKRPERNNGMVRPGRAATSGSTGSMASFASMEASFLNMTPEQLRAFHENLDRRLQPFWSSALQRRVQLSIYPVRVPMDRHPRHEMRKGGEVPVDPPSMDEEPLMRNVFTTDAQGLFAQKIVIPWERIVSHGPSLAMAFHDPPRFEYSTGEPEEQTSTWGLYLKAELLSEGGPNRLPPSATALQPPSSPSFTTGTLADGPKPVELDADMWDPGANAFFSPNDVSLNKGPGGPGGGLMNLGATRVVATTWTPVASVGGVRVISDLDDTVKVSNILSGTREVFRNAFCRPVEETEAEGMSELYRHLATQGVAGFHYVSNSPYELLPVLQSFFKHHAFPTGFSLKLKYYGGRNLMNGLFEPPGDRKRPGIIDVMESFPRAKFVLIGDSGEQDLELYVAIAKQRKDQVLAIAIRDVTTPFTASLHRVPTNMSNTTTTASDLPYRPRSPSRQPSSSEVDLAALSEALAVEGSGVEQASKSGVAGRTRDKARRLISKAGDLDLSDLKLGHRHGSESGRSSRSSSVSGSSSEAGSDARAGSGPRQRKVAHDPSRRHPEDLEEAIANIGAGDDNLIDSTPGTPGSAETLITKQTEAEIQELSATQLKLVKRAAEWTDRQNRARQELPEGIRLFFFEHPAEVEDEIVGIVKGAYGTTPAS